MSVTVSESPAPTLLNEPAAAPQEPSASKSRASDPTPKEVEAGARDDPETDGDVPYEGEGMDASPFVVRYLAGERDNPLNWPSLRRWMIVQVIAVMTLCVAFGSSVYAGGLQQMTVYFRVSEEVATVGLSVYVVGFALGPLLWAPLSEMFGRRNVHLASYLPFAIFHLGCGAARNIETLIVCRFFAGTFGSAPLTNSGGVISDIFAARERALALSLFALAPFMGPVLGPIIGGFIGENTSWRWLFWVQAMFSGVLYCLGALIPETYSPVLLRRKAKNLSKETGMVNRSEYEIKTQGESFRYKLAVNMSRPFILLFSETIVLLFSIYSAMIYGTLYRMFGAFPIVFQEGRGWSEGVGGLPFLGVGVGMMLGIGLNFFVNNKYVRDLDQAGGSLSPEARLPIAAFGSCCLPIGLFWFAWTEQPEVPWIVPIIASVPFGLGMVTVFLATMNYLVDAYLRYAASALAANAVLRSLFGAIFPLFTVQMFHGLGNNWALTLLAFLSLILAPIPFVFMRYGEIIRSHSKFAPGHKATTLSRIPTRKEEDLVEEQREADLRIIEQEQA